MTARCCWSFSKVNRLWEAARAANSIPSPRSCSQHSQNYSLFLNRSFGVVNMSGTRGSRNQQRKREPVAAPVWRKRPVSTQPEHDSLADASEEKGVSSSSPGGTEGGAAEEAAHAASGEKHSVSIEVDAALISFIKRKGYSYRGTTQQIERETGVEIKFPSSKNDSQIVLEGISAESVTEASKRIAGVLEEIAKSPSLDYSHFISLPLAIHPELVEKLENFQNSILGCSTSSHDGNLDSDSSEDTLDGSLDTKGKRSESTNIDVKLEVQDEKEHVSVRLNTADTNSSGSKLPSSSVLSELGIDRSIFIKPRTFHLTVLMLKLWNKDRVAAATEVLQKISSKVNAALDNRPVFISLKGLECMRGSAAKARVVYAPIEEIGGEGRLLQACRIHSLVLEKDARQALKLHATLMNVRHRKSKKRARRVYDFDARGIFLRYGSEDWGNYLIKEAHLSKRFMFEESVLCFNSLSREHASRMIP